MDHFGELALASAAAELWIDPQFVHKLINAMVPWFDLQT